MIPGFFKSTIRNLLKYRTFSLINISGLAIGLACTILILLWLRDELGYDRFHENNACLYRVLREEIYANKGTDISVITPARLGPALVEEFPEIINMTRHLWEDEILFHYNDKYFIEKGRYADGSLFEMFTYPFVAGNPENALNDINSVVISESLAKKYFNEINVVGKTISVKHLGEDCERTITGVFKDIPRNSSLRFDFVLPMEKYLNRRKWALKWGMSQFHTYIQLNQQASQAEIEKKIKDIIQKHDKDQNYNLFLQPYKDIYLFSTFKGNQKPTGRIKYIYIFSFAAAFILIIACLNFIILSTVRSFSRVREVGIKKTIGAKRWSLIFQFWGEALFITTTALLLSILLVELTLPYFNHLTSKSMDIPYSNPVFLITLFIIIIFTSLISGSYPAVFMTSFSPVTVLKGNLHTKALRIPVQKNLVVFQHVISVILIISTILIGKQIHFIKNKNIGIDRENVIQFRFHDGIKKHRKMFKFDLLQHNTIKNYTVSMQNPLSIGFGTSGISWDDKSPDTEIQFSIIWTDYDFLKTFKLKLKEGRDFSELLSGDNKNCIINEEAARQMNMLTPVNQTINVWGETGQIIGLVENFHIHSFHKQVEPLLIKIAPQNANYGYVRVKSDQISRALQCLKKVYSKYEPGYPFEYSFLDDEFNNMYKSEMVLGHLANYFSLFGVFISCLGLFGLSIITIDRRTKEISIRKVLGASINSIVFLLSKEYLKWILFANILAYPAAYYIMDKWLQNYAYRIPIGFGAFLFAALLSLAAMFLTISVQSVRSAMANPVNMLRHE